MLRERLVILEIQLSYSVSPQSPLYPCIPRVAQSPLYPCIPRVAQPPLYPCTSGGSQISQVAIVPIIFSWALLKSKLVLKFVSTPSFWRQLYSPFWNVTMVPHKSPPTCLHMLISLLRPVVLNSNLRQGQKIIIICTCYMLLIWSKTIFESGLN